MSPNRLKNYGIEKWVDKETSDARSAVENRSSLVSDSANQKALEIIANTHMNTIRSNEFFSRHSDHMNNANSLSKLYKYITLIITITNYIELNENDSMSHKAFSNQDIQDLIFSRDKSIQDDNNTQSDKIIDDEFLYKPKISEGGSASPYVPEFNEIERQMSNNSIEDSGHFSDVSFE